MQANIWLYFCTVKMCDGVSPMTGKRLMQAVARCGAPSAAGLTGCRHSILNAGYAGQ